MGHNAKGDREKLRNAWYTMIRKCENPDDAWWHLYGARGITVCKRWHEFENFLADMGERPKGMMLERVDNDGPYSPGNCIWTDAFTQANNTRRNRWLELDGHRMTLNQWARFTGLQNKTIHYRLLRGWSLRQALTAPVGSRRED